MANCLVVGRVMQEVEIYCISSCCCEENLRLCCMLEQWSSTLLPMPKIIPELNFS